MTWNASLQLDYRLKPVVMTNLKTLVCLTEVVAFIEKRGMLGSA
jgi:hypothetical protein